MFRFNGVKIMKSRLIQWLLFWVLECCISHEHGHEKIIESSDSQRIKSVESWIANKLTAYCINLANPTCAGMLFY